MNAADTILRLQEERADLLKERQALLLENAELKAHKADLEHTFEQTLRMLGRSTRRNVVALRRKA